MSRKMLKNVRLLVFVLSGLTTQDAIAMSPGNPAFGLFLGHPLGTLTTAQLEKMLGRGHIEIGGHPKSGRWWDLRNGSALSSDAFYSYGSSLTIDFIWLDGKKGLVSSSFSPKLAKKFGPLGQFHWGADRAQVESLLRSKVGSNSQIKIELKKGEVIAQIPAKASGNTYGVDIHFILKGGRMSVIKWFIQVPEPGIKD